MATTSHSVAAKAASDWTHDDLDALNITVTFQDTATFFNLPHGVLPEPTLNHHSILSTLSSGDTSTAEVFDFLRSMESAAALPPVKDSVIDFISNLFRELRYSPRRGRVIRTRAEIPLLMSGEIRHSTASACILDSNDISLLVLEDRRHMDENDVDPEPPLIAEAISAFQLSNSSRQHLLGLPPLDARLVPGLTMAGTLPVFYKVPVTNELAQAIQSGTYPTTPTQVHAHIPSIPRAVSRFSEAMKPLDNRRVLLGCFEAFKQFVN